MKMKKRFRLRFFALTTMGLLMGVLAWAMASSDFAVDPSVLDSGGGTRNTASEQITDASGQSAIGLSNSVDYQLCAGVLCLPLVTQAIEVDPFPNSVGFLRFRIKGIPGIFQVPLQGPGTIHALLGPNGEADDTDNNSKDEIETELVSLQLTGNHPDLGPVIVRVRDGGNSPFQPSTGQIEEKRNHTPGLLDVDPFAPGKGTGRFETYLEIEIPNLGLILHNETAAPLISSRILNKPAGPGDRYIYKRRFGQTFPIPLSQEGGQPGGKLAFLKWTPDPGGQSAPAGPEAAIESEALVPQLQATVSSNQALFEYNAVLQGATLRVFNIAGRLVFDGELPRTGSLYIWSLSNNQGQPLGNGLYVYVVIPNPDQLALLGLDSEGEGGAGRVIGPKALVIQR